jgi:hypothetical protein
MQPRLVEVVEGLKLLGIILGYTLGDVNRNAKEDGSMHCNNNSNVFPTGISSMVGWDVG